MSIAQRCDVAIIGAGPAGAVAAALLAGKGYDVVILERQVFPRFSIGESLLPQCMIFLEEAGLLNAVAAAEFQPKNGAAFDRGESHAIFDFSDKFTAGWSETFEVQRARFDAILADQAEARGVAVHYDCEITAVGMDDDHLTLSYRGPDGEATLQSRFCLDASGYGQILAKSQDLIRPADWPTRESIFTHVIDNMDAETFDRNKILITVHPEQHDVWFWLIPFSDGSSSLGTVAAETVLARFGQDNETALRDVVGETRRLASLMTGAEFHKPCQRFSGYASNVARLHGDKFALIGNAGGFLDPVFSSGVTIALKSASLAAGALDRQFQGQKVDWTEAFETPLKRGVETFREFVSAWYDGRLQDIIFSTNHNHKIRQMVCSILAGYAWDEENPYVSQTERRLTTLATLCRQQ